MEKNNTLEILNNLPKDCKEDTASSIVKFNSNGVVFFAYQFDIATDEKGEEILSSLKDAEFNAVRMCNPSYDHDMEVMYERYVNGADVMAPVYTVLRRFRRCTYCKESIESWNIHVLNDFAALLEKRRAFNSSMEAIAKAEDAQRVSEQANKKEGKHTLEDYEGRQLRCYTNKLKHGFNVTDFQKEARFILKELSELMDAIEHNDVENLIEELGDIVIFCYGIAEMAHKDLDTQVFKKMAINEGRVYHRNEHGDFVREDKT